MASAEDDEKEVLRAAVTEASCSSAAALTRVQEVLYAFRKHLASAFVSPSVTREFELVLDAVDREMHTLNATTRRLALRIRTCGSIVEEENSGGGDGGAHKEKVSLERSAVGRAASVPLGELRAMLDGLEAGHVRHVLGGGGGGGGCL